MALINLKAVKVARINNSGNGFSVLEENESRGKTYKTYFSIWPDAGMNVNVGDTISLSGFLSTKVGEPKTGTDGVERRYVELSVNSPRINTGDAPSATATAPAAEVWATTAPSAPTAQTGADAFADELPW